VRNKKYMVGYHCACVSQRRFGVAPLRIHDALVLLRVTQPCPGHPAPTRETPRRANRTSRHQSVSLKKKNGTPSHVRKHPICDMRPPKALLPALAHSGWGSGWRCFGKTEQRGEGATMLTETGNNKTRVKICWVSEDKKVNFEVVCCCKSFDANTSIPKDICVGFRKYHALSGSRRCPSPP